MRRKRWLGFCLAVCLLPAFCAGAKTEESKQTDVLVDDPMEAQTELQYDYQLKAGEVLEVSDRTFDQMVTVTIDPDSTRDGARDLRSDLFFDHCTFNGGLTITGDYHAMVTLGSDCSFGEGSGVICKAVHSEEVKKIKLEDNLLKLFAACEGVHVETESAIGVLTDGPDVTFNGTTYSKQELAPDTDFLGIYSIYEGDDITYIKLGIGEDDSVVFLD